LVLTEEQVLFVKQTQLTWTAVGQLVTWRSPAWQV
jgi:hypothetical protein